MSVGSSRDPVKNKKKQKKKVRDRVCLYRTARFRKGIRSAEIDGVDRARALARAAASAIVRVTRPVRP